MQKKIVLNTLGLVLGFIVGNVVVTYAQQIYIADPKNAVCWDQTGASVAELNTWKIQVTYNALAPEIIQQSCDGNNSPFQCKLNTPVPMVLQVTPLRVKLEGATVQPDGSLSSWSTLLDSTLSFGNAIPAPPANSGSNLRIVKLLQQLAKMFKDFFHMGISH